MLFITLRPHVKFGKKETGGEAGRRGGWEQRHQNWLDWWSFPVNQCQAQEKRHERRYPNLKQCLLSEICAENNTFLTVQILGVNTSFYDTVCFLSIKYLFGCPRRDGAIVERPIVIRLHWNWLRHRLVWSQWFLIKKSNSLWTEFDHIVAQWTAPALLTNRGGGGCLFYFSNSHSNAICPLSIFLPVLVQFPHVTISDMVEPMAGIAGKEMWVRIEVHEWEN